MSASKKLSAPVPPGGTIGILGGGQLGRMLALAAARLGLKTHIFSDRADAPAFDVAAAHTLARFDDRSALERFARACNALTFEFENVPADAVAWVSALAPTNPNARAAETAQDRLAEKNFVRSLGVPTAAYQGARTEDEAARAFDSLGAAKAVLKTCRYGYDGKGQAVVASASEAARAFRALKGVPAILEAFVGFAFEASVIAARAGNGAFAAYDPPENTHREGILRRSVVPGRIPKPVASEAKAIAKKIADALDYVGVIAVEFFVKSDGALLVNEIAPRVHNSGHWTIEACAVSQFEQHVRAIAGWPLGDPKRHANAVMENIIGEEAEAWEPLAARGGGLHLYGKTEIRPGRKMGHITLLSALSE